MKQFYYSLIVALCCIAWLHVDARTQWTLNGKAYDVDTLIYTHPAGPGVTVAKFDLPQIPLKVSVMEIDLTNPYIQFETCLGGESAVGCETPTSMVARNSRPGHEVVGATNGDFYMTNPPAEVGMPRSGQLRRSEVVVNPVGTACFVLDENKRPYIDRVDFHAQAVHNGKTFRVHTMNMLRLEYENTGGNQTFLFTNSYGKNTYACASGKLVLIAPKSGDFKWKPNSTETCVVEQVIDPAGAIPIPQGKAYMWMQGTDVAHANAMKPGDELTITNTVSLRAQGGAHIDFKEMVGGSNTIIMRNGKQEDLWEDKHPRTCIGFNEDSTRMVMLVVDGRSLKSNGISMTEAYGIFKELNCVNAVNLDGGGSTCMVVNDEVINTPSDGPIRAVGNGCLVISTAPVDDEIGILNFAPRSYNVSVAAQIYPSVWGYNKYGVLKTRDVEGCTFTCDPQVGTISEDGIFTAALTAGYGYIYASKDGITTKQLITVSNAEQALRCDSVVIDKNHPYTIEVISTSGESVDLVNPAVFQWSSADESICTVTDEGIVKAVANGRTMIYGTGATFNDTLVVIVQNPKARVACIEDNLDPTTWTVSQSGGKDRTVSAMENGMKIEFTGSSSRSAYIKLAKKLELWGLPDTLRVRFRPNGVGIKRVSMSTSVRGGNQVISEITKIDTIGDVCVVNLPTNEWCKAEDLNNYPLNFVYLYFLTETPTTGEKYSFEIPGIELIYNYDDPVVYGDVNGDGAVDVADVNACIDCILGYNSNEKADVTGDGDTDIADVNEIINLILGLSHPYSTCAQVLEGKDGQVFKVKGTCTYITNATHGNWYITDSTGQVNIYGTLDKDGKADNFESLGIAVGDTVTVEGPKTTTNSVVQLVDVKVLNVTKQ